MAAKIILFRPAARYKEQEDFLIEVNGFPHSLLHLAAPLVARGYEVVLIDEIVNRDWETYLPGILQGALCAGISSMTGEQIARGFKFAQAVRRYSDIPLIWGGFHVSALPQQSLQHQYVDIAVVGEGEATLLELVQALESGSPLSGIPGCGFKDNTGIRCNPAREASDLKSLPPLPFELVQLDKYFYPDPYHLNSKRTFEVFSSRGCRHKCRFCNIPQVYKHYNSKSLEQIAAEIDYAARHHDFDGLRFRDDTFFSDKARVRAIAEWLIASGYKLKWYGNCRVDLLLSYEPEFLKLLKASGLTCIGLGFESGSPRVLHYIEKGFTVPQIIAAGKLVDDYRIRVQYNFMVSLPHESYRDVLDTLGVFYEVSRNPDHVVVGPLPYIPYPGTPMYEDCLALGMRMPASLEEWSQWRVWRCVTPDEPRHFESFLRNIKILVNCSLGRFFWRPWFRFRLFMLGKLKWTWTAFSLFDVKLLHAWLRVTRYREHRRSRLEAGDGSIEPEAPIPS